MVSAVAETGVPPVQQLHAGQMHGRTPASIPGGQLLTTKGLVELIQSTEAEDKFEFGPVIR